MNRKIICHEFQKLAHSTHFVVTHCVLRVCCRAEFILHFISCLSCKTSGKKSQFFTSSQYLYLFKLKKYFLCINNRVAKQLAKNKKKRKSRFRSWEQFYVRFLQQVELRCSRFYHVLHYSLLSHLAVFFWLLFRKKDPFNRWWNCVKPQHNVRTAAVVWLKILIRMFSSLSRKHQPTVTSIKTRAPPMIAEMEMRCVERSAAANEMCVPTNCSYHHHSTLDTSHLDEAICKLIWMLQQRHVAQLFT